MTQWSFEAQMQAAQAIADQWGGWMRSTGADEVVAEYEAVGPRAAVSSQVLHQGQWMNNALPMELVGLGLNLPRWGAPAAGRGPGRGCP